MHVADYEILLFRYKQKNIINLPVYHHAFPQTAKGFY